MAAHSSDCPPQVLPSLGDHKELEAELGEVLRFPDVAVTTLIFANPRYVNQTTKARQVGLTGLVFIETIFGTRLSGGGGDRT